MRVLPGCLLGASWVLPGYLLDASWIPPGYLLGASWVPLGCLLGTYCAPCIGPRRPLWDIWHHTNTLCFHGVVSSDAGTGTNPSRRLLMSPMNPMGLMIWFIIPAMTYNMGRAHNMDRAHMGRKGFVKHPRRANPHHL